MATKKRSSIPLSGSGIDWSTLALDPAANPEPAAEDAGPPTMLSRMKRGFGSTMNAAAIGAAGRDDLAGLVAGEAANQLPGSPAAQAMQQEVKPYVDAANNAEGLQAVGAWATLAAKRIGQFASNPREFAGMIAENLPNSVPGMAGTIAGGMAGAAAAGPVGGLAGSVVGGTAGGYLIEQGAAMREQIMKEAQARGVDARDPNALAPIIAEKYDEFLKSARLKGIGTAGTDAILNRLTLGIAGMGEKAIIKGAGATGTALKAGAITAEQAGVTMTELAAKQAARTTMGRGLARGAGVTGMEMAGEGLSEAAGQALAYGKVDAGDVVDESLLGLGQGGAMAATRGMYGKAVGASTSSDADAAIASLGESIRATKLPEGGPMTRAANAATEAQAKAAEAGKPPLEFTTTDLPPGKADSLALADKPDSTALDFEADPRFAGAMPFDNGAAPAQPVFSSKTLADIHIGEQGAMGEMEAVEAGGGQWTVKQTDQAANRTARANIEQWTLKAQPMPEERARSMVKDAETQLGKKMTALPMPDGSGWTVVPTQWVSAPILMDYVEHASAAEQALAAEQAVADRAVADRNARVSKAASEPVKRAPRTPSTGAVEIDLAAPNAVAQFIAKQAGINTPAARAFVQGYRAGRITDDEVLARINPKRTSEPSADERIAAAAAQAPAPAPSPAGLILNREGQPFKSERAANIEHKKHAGSSVVQVPGGHAVQPATDAKPAAAAADTGASDDQAKAASVPAPADPAAVEKVADPAGAGTAEAPATGAAGPVPGPAGVEDGGVAGRAKAIDAFKRVNGAKFPERDHQRTAEMMADRLLPLIEAKSADGLLALNIGSADMNPGSRAAFEAVTGVKLPKGRAASERAIDEWAGVTEQQRSQKDAARKSDVEAKSADRELQSARRAASEINVKDGERSVDGASWVDELIGKGFTKIVRRGPKTFLANEAWNGWPMTHKDIAEYARKKAAAKPAPDATHKDPGEPAEPVTAAVVRDAIKTGVQATDRKPSTMKAELLAEIDQAVKDAPDYPDFQDVVKSRGLEDATAVFTDARGKLGDKAAPQGYSRPTLRFKIEGDGVFSVNNTVRQLLTFRAKVEASPGFRDRQAPAGLRERATTTLDRRSTEAAIAGMVDEGDFQAALDFADAKGLDISDVKLSKVLRDRIDGWAQTAARTTTGQQTTTASNAAAQDTQPAPDGEAAGATEAAAPTEAPAALPDPFADNYTALNGTTITQQVLVADTGKTATLRMDAGQALRDVNEREQALTKLKACIGR